MKHSILIIDDNIYEAKEMKKILDDEKFYEPEIFKDVGSIDIETKIYDVCDKIAKAFPHEPEQFPYRLIITDVYMPDPNNPNSLPSEDHGGLMLHDFIKKKRAEITDPDCLKLMPRLIITSGQQKTIHNRAAKLIAESSEENDQWAYVMPKPDTTMVSQNALSELLPKRVWRKIVEAGITSIKNESWLNGFLTGSAADMQGISVRIQEVRQAIQDRKNDYIVIVMGNTGTGKEFIAKALWEARGKKGHFQPVILSQIAGKTVTVEHFNTRLFGCTKEYSVTHQLTNTGYVEACGSDGTLWIDEAKVTLLQEIYSAVLRFFDKDIREWEKVGSTDKHIFNGQIVLSSNDYDDNFEELPEKIKGRLPNPDNWIRLPSINEIKEDIALLAKKYFTKAIETKLKNSPKAPKPVLNENFLNTLIELVKQRRIKSIVDQNVRGLEKFVTNIANNYKEHTNRETMEIGSEYFEKYVTQKTGPTVSTDKLTILHLSDAHFSEKDDASTDSVFSSLLKDIESSELIPNLIVFSGDLVYGCQNGCSSTTCKQDYYPHNCPLPKQYEKAITFLNKIAEAKNLDLENIPLLIVPGNHDVNRHVVYTAVENSCRPSSREEARKLIEDKDTWNLILNKQKYWYKRVNDLSNATKWEENYYFPYGILNVGTNKIGFVGLNSCLGSFNDNDEKNLWIDDEQIERAKNLVKETDFTIIAMHHPVDWMANYIKTDLSHKIESRFDMFLHGHEHDEWFSDSNGHLKVASGAAHQGMKNNVYSWIVMDLETNQGTIYLRQFDDISSKWVAKHIEDKTNTDGVGKIEALFLSGKNNNTHDK